ncbi:MAG: PorT family protein [Bacteroidales bacterium]|jgi:hypothetical protein|nr:PorT family protein [Bacteroidales bacterium]
MKKIITSLFLCLLLAPVFGQGVKFGILLEPTISWLRSDIPAVKREKARLGINIGLAVDYYFASNYAFASGISLFFTGGTLSYENGTTLKAKGDTDGTVSPGGNVLYKLQYLKIPLGLKLRTHQIGRFRYFADLGLDPMIKILARANYESFDNVGIGKSIKGMALGYHIGGGMKYSLGGDASLIFGLTYMNIFTDITSDSKDRISSNNLVIRFGVSF